ncbi:hypothetical protein OAJ57_04240 [Alphaproteobacteria bacterium]|nr:hypothetical protein [Alphaproteobacteria bacterium]
MKLSAERILITYVGNMPRLGRLVEFLRQDDRGETIFLSELQAVRGRRIYGLRWVMPPIAAGHAEVS